jgi:hypothetical protein
MLGPRSTSFCCHWLCRREAKCGAACRKTPEPTACTGTQKHCPKSPGTNDFAAELKGSLILGLHTGFQSSFFVLFVHMLITQLVIRCDGLG